MGRLSPCKNCKQRQYPTCYSTCEAYQTFREEKDRIAQKRQESVAQLWYEVERNRRIKKRMR